MVDRNTNTTSSGSNSELSLPRFDEHASNKAQPVTPIPQSIVAVFFKKAGELFTHSSRSLALIVALGVATGALVGIALAKETPMPGEVEQAAVLSNSESPQVLEWQDAEVGVYGIQNAAGRISRAVARRSRTQSDGQPRAYRFAVIR